MIFRITTYNFLNFPRLLASAFHLCLCLHSALTPHFHALNFAVLQKPCQVNFGKFQRSGESRFGGSEKDRWFLKIPKWQHKLARYYKRGKLVSYFLNNAAKTCLYGLKISENIEIGHFFQSRTLFHLNSNLHTSCLSAFKVYVWWKGTFCNIIAKIFS